MDRTATVQQSTARIFALALLLLAAFAPVPAGAHARLLRADPAPGAMLNRAPAELRLWFSARLETAFSTVEVLDHAGNKVSELPARVSPADLRLLILKLRPLSAGQYVVKYRVLSIDGHVVESSFAITVKSSPLSK